MYHFITENLLPILTALGGIGAGGLFASRTSKRRDKLGLYEQMDRQIAELQKDQKKFWEELQEIRLERDALEREVISLRSENAHLKKSVAALRLKLNKYIRTNKNDGQITGSEVEGP